MPVSLKSKRRLRVTLAVSVAVALLLAGLDYIGVIGGNVRTVVPGRVYRSAELTGDTLRRVLASRHIATVINLRGFNDAPWYGSEISVCRQMHVDHDDIALSAQLVPPPAKLDHLLDDFDHARYPVLFHCQGGADRSGLVGTLYLVVYRGVPLDTAEREQLTWRYGHVRGGETRAMDEFFDLYRRTSGGLPLRAWIETRYPAIFKKVALEGNVDYDDD
jgi:hypothetical protein